MKRRFLRWFLTPALVAGLVAAGTGVANASAGSAAKLKSATLNGSGSTFQALFDTTCIAAFKQNQPDVTINYAGGGSGTGRQNFADQVVQFAGTDAPYPAADLTKVKGGTFFYFPTVVAPITVSFNLSGVKKLNFSPSVLAKIFQATITKWNDPAIAADNPKATLPSTTITVARRADSSGTTQNFTTYLTKAAPTDWKLGASSTIAWPASTQGAQGNGGVANLVKSTDGAIGYVDFPDAKAAGLTYGAVKNQSLKFVTPSVKSASAAAETAAVNPNLTYDPIYAPGPKAYPITSPTWVLIYENQSDAAVGQALKGFMTFMLTKGQTLAPTINFSPIPKRLQAQALAQVKKIKVG